MTTCIGNARIGYLCLGAASSSTILPHGHHDTAPAPQIGTIFQLGSSYAGRNNRNKISYENAFSSYARVPILRYGSTSRRSAVPAQSSPAQLQIAPGTHSLPSLHRNKNPKLFQSWNRNRSLPPKAPQSLNPAPARYEFHDNTRLSYPRTGTSLQAVSKLRSEQERLRQNCPTPRTVPSQIRTASGVRPFPDKIGTPSPSCFKAAIGTIFAPHAALPSCPGKNAQKNMRDSRR